MTVLGLIVEYNPFHNGHLFHIQQAKKMVNPEVTIAVMSGPFVQRGEPAIVDKWTRTKMAINNGIDLIIELPVIYSTQAAEWFAFGAISLLDQLGAEHVIFGSESNSIPYLNELASFLADEPFDFQSEIKKNLSLGHSYPKAFALSLQQYQFIENHLDLNPNDILGLQYLVQIKKINSKMKPLSIKRKSSSYHDQFLPEHSIGSATAIRNSLQTFQQIDRVAPYLPQSAHTLLKEEMNQGRIHFWENFFSTIKIMILNQSMDQLKQIHGMIEGLEYRLKNSIPYSASFTELITNMKTKRYTQAKLQRLMVHLLLNLTNEKIDMIQPKKGPQYIRVLGFNQTGREFLKKYKHQNSLPIITNLTKERSPMLDLDVLASDIYESGFVSPHQRILEYKQSPFKFL